MASSRDMTKANWARTVPRLRRLAVELISFGFTVQEPADLETRPREPDWKEVRVLASGGIVMPGRAYFVGESAPEPVEGPGLVIKDVPQL